MPQPSRKVEELVAPIALYPDVLVAQILAAATQPAEVVHAALWLENHRDASAFELAQAVDGQPWDASIKALTLFPDVLAAMNRDRAWTTALGEAFAADPADVLGAVQAMRRKARAAGELASSSEQRVVAWSDRILIEPTNPDFVHVPGARAFDIRLGGRFPWRWHSWNIDWQHGALTYQDAPYLSARE
jgi:hypothetical protein